MKSLFISLLFLITTSLYSQRSQCTNAKVDVTLKLGDNSSRITLFHDDLIVNNYDGISFNIYISDKRTRNVGNIFLNFNFPGTTLEPIKIPPPPIILSKNITNLLNSKTDARFFKNINLPMDALDNDGYVPLDRGENKFGLSLTLVTSRTLSQTQEIPFDVYDINSDSHPQIRVRNLNVYKVLESNNILVKTKLKTNQYVGCDTKIKYYIANENYLTRQSRLVGEKIIDPIRFDRNKEIDFTINGSLYRRNIGKYLIAYIDNEYPSEKSILINSVNQLPTIGSDLILSDARVYKHSNGKIAISCTVTNIGNVTSPRAKVTFKEKEGNRRAFYNTTIPTLLPGESKAVTTYVTQNEFNVYLALNTIIFSVDRDNSITELDETNNEKTLRLVNSVGTQNYVTVSPNPFSSSNVNFDFQSSDNLEVKLHIYDSRGILKYATREFYTAREDQRIRVPSSYMPNTGMYHYSFLIGKSGRYISYTGTIVRK